MGVCVDLSVQEGSAEAAGVTSSFSSCPLLRLPGVHPDCSRACVFSFVPTADLSSVWLWQMKP